MKLQVLGSYGGGAIGFHLSAFLLNEELLLDAGSVISHLSITEQLKIKGVFITHSHFDHIRDLPVLADNFLAGESTKLRVFSIPEVIEALKKHIFNDIIWPDFTKIPSTNEGILEFIPVYNKKKFNFEGYEITPIFTKHTVPSTGYLFCKDGKKLFYSGDTGPNSEPWISLKGIELDALIAEVSFPERMEDIAIASMHYTPSMFFKEVLTLSPPPKNIYVFHLKPSFKEEISKEIEKLKKHYDVNNIRVLENGEVIHI
ncbi:MAG: 3',5'-cyclic-nucleotide phosphodiesterase [Thermodesulfobacteria bacterium]|nr:3',5'-cyclic-nucleotide phosphodiesterase [Thermodesulfobacteriota bacterium]